MARDKALFYDLIVSKSNDPAKPAITSHTGEHLAYGKLIESIVQTRTALERFDVKSPARVALITADHLSYIPIMLGLMETATLMTWENGDDMQIHLEYLEILAVDYLLCDQPSGAIADAARIKGTGIILFSCDTDKNLVFELVSHPAQPVMRTNQDEDIVCVYTTSGTTSKVKVVPRSYDDMLHSITALAAYDRFDANSIQLLPIKLEREISQRLAIISLITNGRLIYTDGAFPQRIVAALQNYPITHFYYQPAGMIALLEYLEKSGVEFRHRQKVNVILAGAPLSGDLKTRIERRLNADVNIAYGLTEVGHIASSCQAPQGYREGSVGIPFHLEVRIHDSEIQVKGPHLFPGYENHPKTDEASFSDGWFRTGDAGFLDDNGYLFITGRFKELINRGGEKVSPYELEEAIKSLGHIQDAAIFPYPNRKGYENVGAVVVSGDGPPIRLRELRAALKDQIKPFKLPTLLYQVDRIPASAANKVQRNLLYDQLAVLGYSAESLRGASGADPYQLTSTQYVIREIWENILDQEFLSLDDNFFDIGGDSLSAAEVLAAIEDSLGCVLPVNEFFTKSTIRELAELADATPKSYTFKHLVPLRPGGTLTPIFFMHDINGDVVSYHLLAENLYKERPIYGLNLNLTKETWGPATTMREVALAYAREIQAVQKSSPYYLAGLSIGGQIAYEVGWVLAQQGFPVIVFMLDTYSRRHARNTLLQSSVRGTISSFKNARIGQWPSLIYKKMGTLQDEYVLSEFSARARHLVSRRLERRWGDIAAVSDRQVVFMKSLLQTHQPDPLPGKVVYFRALQQQLARNSSYRYWESRSSQFILLEANCRHADFVKRENAAYTAQLIDNILETEEIAH
ncbi:MAG: AMP-binding protein [Syntrophomonas sp.]|nr:AMP-binding protein [Syntrophomonas sp.]